MKMKPVAMLSPLCLAMFAGAASAAIEPFTLGASEMVQHQSNISHTLDSQRTADWISTTEFSAALDQAVGRDKLIASAAVDFNRYLRTHSLNSTGYRAGAEFDWSTVGNLSGAFGADANRSQYVYGSTALVPGTTTTVADVRNLQTNTHEFARATLGADSRWQIFGGADFNQRRYSSDLYRADDEQQWSGNLGTRYQTSPDLSFGLQGTYVSGKYLHGAADGGASDFSSRSLDATTRWQASGNSLLTADLGVTSDSNDALIRDRRFIDGGLNWTWTPPSHFTVNVGLRRSSDADPTTGATVGVLNANNLTGTSINNVGHLEVTYALTAKIGLDATADYTQRKYSDLRLFDGTDVNGTTRTSRLFLTVHYQPTRIADLSCGGGRETLHVDSRILFIIPAYTDNYLQCVASIRFQ